MNWPDSSRESKEAGARLLEAHDEIVAKLDGAGIDWKLDYEFPDGSLYLGIASEFGEDQTKELLERITGRSVTMFKGSKEKFEQKQKRY